jgi:hypothetical protein
MISVMRCSMRLSPALPPNALEVMSLLRIRIHLTGLSVLGSRNAFVADLNTRESWV